MTIKHYVWLCFCVSTLYANVATDGEKLEANNSNYRIGVWELRFTNKVNRVTYDQLKRIVDISSNLTVSLRKEVQNVHLEGIVVNVKESKTTTCVVCQDNHSAMYELSCEMQRPFGAKVSISIRENDVNVETSKYFSIKGALVTTDAQLNVMPTLEDADEKTMSCYIVAVSTNCFR